MIYVELTIPHILHERDDKMSSIFIKLRLRGNASKYRKMLSTDHAVFLGMTEMVDSCSDYTPGALLDTGEWFRICNISREQFTLDILNSDYETLDFDSLARNEFSQIDFLFVVNDNTLFFQNVSKSKLASKKHIWEFGEEYRFQNECNEIVVNDYPDAIYCQESDTLYFRKLESITSIFKGIDQLYREATDEETAQFLQNDFLQLKEDYSAASVKTANRKRIALATNTLSELDDEDRSNIFTYIGEYCPELKTLNDTFSVGSEDELKMLLFGIEQRFYTTPVGGEKRIANSVIPLHQGEIRNG